MSLALLDQSPPPPPPAWHFVQLVCVKPEMPACWEAISPVEWHDAQLYFSNVVGWQAAHRLAPPWFIGNGCGPLKPAGSQALVE